MVSFFLRYMRGEVGEDAIHDHIDAWHEGKSDLPLSAYLGFTVDEYAEWLRNPACLPDLAMARRRVVKEG